MKRMVAYLAALAAVGGIAGYASWVRAQQPGGAPPANAAAQPQGRPKIALVNIVKVLKNYHKATFQGKEISAKRQGYVDRLNAIRTQISEANKQIAATQVPADRDRLEKQIRELQRQGEDVEREAQKVVSELSNNTLIQVYKEICAVIDAYATAHGYELILCYPDASDPKDSTVMIAQLKLQTPALMPFYHSKGMDLTEGVIATLNARYPAPQASAAPNGAPPANTANGNGQPAARPQQ